MGQTANARNDQEDASVGHEELHQEGTNEENGAFQPHTASLLKQIVQYVPGAVLPALLTLGSTYLFTRLFHTKDFGEYTFVFNNASIIVLLLSQWLQQAIGRYLPGETDQNEIRRLKDTIALSSFGLIGLVAIALGVIQIMLPTSPWHLFILPSALYIALSIVYSVLRAMLVSEMRATAYSNISILANAATFGISYFLVAFVSHTPAALLWGSALGLLIPIPIIWRLTKMSIPSLGIETMENVWRQIKKYAAYGFPVVGWFLSAAMLNVGDRYVIEYFRGSAEVGIYGANYDLVMGGANLMTAPILFAAHPYLMRAWEDGDYEGTADWMGRIVGWFLISGMMLVGILSLFCHDVARLILGQDFRQGAGAMPVVFAGLLVWQVSMYAHKPFEFIGKTTWMFSLSVLSGVLNIVLNVLLVPAWGYMASAYITFVCYLLYFVLVSVTGRRFLAWTLEWAVLLRVFLMLGVAFTILSYIRNYLLYHWGYVQSLLVSFVGCLSVLGMTYLLMRHTRFITMFKRKGSLL